MFTVPSKGNNQSVEHYNTTTAITTTTTTTTTSNNKKLKFTVPSEGDDQPEAGTQDRPSAARTLPAGHRQRKTPSCRALTPAMSSRSGRSQRHRKSHGQRQLTIRTSSPPSEGWLPVVGSNSPMAMGARQHVDLE